MVDFAKPIAEKARVITKATGSCGRLRESGQGATTLWPFSFCRVQPLMASVRLHLVLIGFRTRYILCPERYT